MAGVRAVQFLVWDQTGLRNGEDWTGPAPFGPVLGLGFSGF